MTEAITGIIGALSSLVTGFFATDGTGAALAGIGLLTGTVLGVALLRKGANKAKGIMG